MRLSPLPGESFDSWLIAYAHRLDSPITDMLVQAEADPRALATEPRTLARGPRDPLLAQVSHLTGHPRHELEQTFRPLRRYEEGLRAVHVSGRSFLPRTMRSSRFCPACLAANGGRWLAGWRMPWFVACPVHDVLLAIRCPSCDAPQRQRRIRTAASPNDPRCCAEPAANATGRSPALCSADLTQVATGPADLRLVELAAAWQLHHDEDRVADLVRLVGDVAVMLPVVTNGASAYLTGNTLKNPRDFAASLAPAAEVAMNPTGDLFRQFASARLSRKAPALPAGWTGISPALMSQALAIRDQHLRPLDRVRWSTTTRASEPTGGHAAAEERVGRLPASLWPDWTLRLMPPGLATAAIFPTAATAALLLRGSTLAVPRLVELLSDDPTDVRGSGRTIVEMAKTDQGNIILRCLALMAEALESDHPCPIDYGRRRRMAARDGLLTSQQWRDICTACGSAPGEARKRGYARLRLWEILTGGMAHQAPNLLVSVSNDPLSTYYEFVRRLTPQLIQALESHARSVLDGWGLADEPLRWSPPARCLGEFPDDWPGLTREHLDEVLKPGVFAGKGALRDIAVENGLDLQQARLVVALGWFAPPPVPIRPLGAPLDETQVRDAIEVRRLTLRQAAAELGVDRKTVGRRCRELGIELDAPGRHRRWSVDPDWLHHQYLDEGRPLRDLAAEVGCSPANLARIAKEHGIPLRSRGAASHRSATVVAEGVPRLLADCLRGQSGRTRVERFHSIATCRSLNQAAQILGTSQSVLSTQLRRLEEAAGGSLLIRSNKGHEPLRLTALGRKLLKQAVDDLGLPEVRSDPEPLDTALRSFRGAERVAKLARSASQPTMRAAAAACGVAPGSLRSSIRGLEASCGPLVGGLRVNDPIQLTKNGSQLVRQWRNRGSHST